MKKLLIAMALLLTLGAAAQKNGVYKFYYHIDSVWVGQGDPSIPMVELYKQGKVWVTVPIIAQVEIHFGTEDSFRDRIIFVSSVPKLHDTLFVQVESHLAEKSYITLSMKGWLKAKNVDKESPDYKVFYVLNHDSKLIVYRLDEPERRAIYFISPINQQIPKKHENNQGL